MGKVGIPGSWNSARLPYMHGGKRYGVLPIGGNGHAGSLVALALPDEE